jgi:hypothetical protein
MSKIRASRIADDIRSGIGDEGLMRKYSLSRKALRKLLKILVNDDVIAHDEVYGKSETYRAIADLLTARLSPRVYVPIAIRVYKYNTSEKGFLRDISQAGVRVAGIEANVGDEVHLCLPLKELIGTPPLEFMATCRWSRLHGKTKTYSVCGFEVTSITAKDQQHLLQLIEFFRGQDSRSDRTFYSPLNVPEMIESARQMREETESREFCGTIEGVDILDVVQFLMLSGRRIKVQVKSADGAECQVYLEDGRIIHACSGELTGKMAFFECMNFPGGEFSALPWHGQVGQTIFEAGEFLLVESARRRDEAVNGSEEDDD